MSPMLAQIQSTYQRINRDTLKAGILRTLYADSAEFIDPFHHIQGIANIEAYFSQLYQNVTDISFQYGLSGQLEQNAWQEWHMTVRHPKLAKGAPIIVAGITQFKLEHDKIVVHRDYFDAGALLYEHVPILGSVIRTLKQRMGQRS
jgi:limonene-1,2-epoxide hydrolase